MWDGKGIAIPICDRWDWWNFLTLIMGERSRLSKSRVHEEWHFPCRLSIRLFANLAGDRPWHVHDNRARWLRTLWQTQIYGGSHGITIDRKGNSLCTHLTYAYVFVRDLCFREILIKDRLDIGKATDKTKDRSFGNTPEVPIRGKIWFWISTKYSHGLTESNTCTLSKMQTKNHHRLIQL